MTVSAALPFRFRLALECLDERLTPAAPLTRLSVVSGGAQATQASANPSVSASGRFVAFETTAQLTAADTNSSSDVYLADRANGSITLVSADGTGRAAGNSASPAISGDGTAIAFESSAAGLVPGFSGGATGIFLRDLSAGTMSAISRTNQNNPANDSSFRPSISNDGRFVAYESLATNLVTGFGGARFAVFVFDRTAQTVSVASISSTGTAPDTDAFDAEISGDGRYVVYQSAASNVVPGFGGAGRADIFVRDRTGNTNAVASADSTATAANAGAFSPNISDDGRFVVFESAATDLVNGFGGNNSDVFVRDMVGGGIDVASRSTTGGKSARPADNATISGNGRYVAFLSDAADLVPTPASQPAPLSRSVYVWDTQGTATTLAATPRGTGGTNPIFAPILGPLALSRDGQFLAFASADPGLVPAGADTNGVSDVFLVERPIRSGFATGAGPGGGPVAQLYNADGSLRFSIEAYPNAYTGGVFVAMGDVTGDGADDLVTSTGRGGAANIRVFDGRTGALLRSFFGYPPQFLGGVNVALGDVNGDGFADIVCGVGVGGGPNVRVFSGRDGALLSSFFAYDSGFLGGVRVASADVNNDGFADIVCAVGSGGGPNVRVFDGRTGALLTSFFAYASTFTGGLFVSTGDVNNDGVPDLITGVESGGGPNVRAFDVRNGDLERSFFAFDQTLSTGVRVSTADVNGDGFDDFVVGSGAGPGSQVRIFSGINGTTQLLPELTPFGAFRGGVNVG